MLTNHITLDDVILDDEQLKPLLEKHRHKQQAVNRLDSAVVDSIESNPDYDHSQAVIALMR